MLSEVLGKVVELRTSRLAEEKEEAQAGTAAEEAAAVRVQSAVRGKVARRQAAELRAEHGALQLARAREEHEDAAALRVQSAYRGAEARKKARLQKQF